MHTYMHHTFIRLHIYIQVPLPAELTEDGGPTRGFGVAVPEPYFELGRDEWYLYSQVLKKAIKGMIYMSIYT
jgi:hypothetical protein